ncbi:NADH-quinone oxidoreductase subunit NuoN [Candidatus Pelagibacter sp.]|nr:NADH-quinone oxidoreductase subunit NuoN [Candidatus Pelagibacter sp.]
MISYNLILPEIFISLSIMFLLIFGVFKKNSSKIVYNLSTISLIIGLGLLLVFSETYDNYLFLNSYKIDNLSFFMKVLTILSGISVLLISYNYIEKIKIIKIEYPILILSAILGMLVMISSNDLMVFYMGLELQSLPLYVLAAINTNNVKSSEAGLKYFVLSALSSGLLLYGCSLVYGFSGSTNFDVISSNIGSEEFGNIFGIIFILVGLSFKISAVPFHMWAPDVYEGSPTTITLFFSLVPKIAALTVFIRFLYVPFIDLFEQWQSIIVFISIASMLLGSFAAIGQTNIKRLIAYSSIGHIGYALAGLAVGTNLGIQSSIAYITIYLIMNLGFFSCLLMLKRNDVYYETINDLSGLSKNHPIISLCFLIQLFSLAGIPPLAGFFAKFYIFIAVIEQSMYFLAIVGLLATVVSAFYYLRIIKVIYFDKPNDEFDRFNSLSLKLILSITTIILVLYFIYPGFLFKIVENITFV